MSYEVTIGTDNNISVSLISNEYGVTLSQVGQQGSKGANWEGAWVTSTAYKVNDVVKNNGTVYICILAHTADAASEPGVGGSTATYWEVFAEGGADGTDGDGWTGGSYNASTGIVTFTSTDGLGFTTGDLRGIDGTDGDGWTGGSYDAGTGVVTFTSTDGLGFATGDLRGTDGTGFTGGSYNASTGVVTFTSDDGLGFATGDLRGIDWKGSWVTSTSYDANDTVENNGSSYICILTHTSASTNEPGVGVDTATYWELIAQKGADGDGAGTVTSVDVAGGTGIDSSGGPVTSSGTITVALDSATQASLDLADTSVQPADIGTAAPLDVPATGDAAAGEVVKGDDTRLSDARTPTAHTHVEADITDLGNYQVVLTEGAFVDGDKTKLNGIEAGATADQTGVEIKTAYEAEANTNAFTDAEKTKLTGIEAGADVTDTVNVTAAGALMDSEVTNLAQVKAFDSADYATAAQGTKADNAMPKAGGTFTGNVTFDETTETVYNLTGTSIDPANGTIQYKTLTANTTFTEALADGQSVLLRLAGGATYTVTWFTVTWVGGSTPTLTADDVLVFWREGATVYGNYLGSVT